MPIEKVPVDLGRSYRQSLELYVAHMELGMPPEGNPGLRDQPAPEAQAKAAADLLREARRIDTEAVRLVKDDLAAAER